MPTLERARRVQNGMGYGYYIYWDLVHLCYRVMNRPSHLWYRDWANYVMVS